MADRAGATPGRSDWQGSHGSMIGLSVTLALFSVSAAKLAGSDETLAAFAAGIALNAMVDRAEEQEEEKVQEAITRLFSMPVFVLLGVVLPWQGWLALG